MPLDPPSGDTPFGIAAWEQQVQSLLTGGMSDQGVIIGAATGGNQGGGTINATGLFVNGIAVSSGGGLANPMTSSGDMIYGLSRGTPTRLPIGAASNFLIVSSGLPSWTDLYGGANTWTAANTFQGTVAASSNVTVGGAETVTGTLTASSNLSIAGTLSLSSRLGVPSGGTGSSTLTNHGVLVGAGTAAITQLAVPSSNTILQGNSSADPSFTATPTVTTLTTTGAVSVGTTLGVTNTLTASSNLTVASPGKVTINSNINGATTIAFGGTTNEHLLQGPPGQWRWLNNAQNANNYIFTDAGNLGLQTGILNTYKGVSTVGLGVPAIYGYGRTAAAVAAVASVATYTVGAADGSFDISANVNVVSVTLCSFTVTCSYTDETNTPRVLTLGFTQLTGATLLSTITQATGTGPYEGIVYHLRCKAATAITIASAAGGVYTTVSYNIEGKIVQTA